KTKVKKRLSDQRSLAVSKMAGYEGTETRSGKMIFEPILEEGVFRFDCSADDRHAAFPSISFENSKFPLNTSFYGTGEASGQLERTGKRIFTWNTDAWGYGAGTTSLYQSHPWVLAVLPNGEALGVLADTTRRCAIDLRKESNVKLISSSAYPVITFGPFASPVDVLASFSRAVDFKINPGCLLLDYLAIIWKSNFPLPLRNWRSIIAYAATQLLNSSYSPSPQWLQYDGYLSDVLTSGTVFMPPKWSLGYHQCRWSYHSDGRVREEQFPDPKTLADDLHQHGFKAIWMLDPGIKKEEGYFVGCVARPLCFPDFTQSSVRSWWANLVKDFISNGVDGIWNDMNEPALFKALTRTMPESNIHREDSELGGHQNHSHYHNVLLVGLVYGMLMVRSTYEGMKLSNEQKRPFVLTRAGFVGSQRYAATWTGDNLSTWERLHMSISMVVQLGLSGQPLSGPDIGGFAGNATPKLFGRWMGVGSMFPFCRGHSEADTVDHEPWSFGEECEEVCRLALRRRYRFLPHIYTLFYMAHTRGIPVATPTFFAGVISNAAQVAKGIWFSFDFEDSHLDLPALYLQGGSIIPVAPPYQHVGEANPTDDLLLLVALNENGKAEGMLFEDDGDGYEYTKGGYLLTTYVAEKQSSVVTVKVLKAEGPWKRPNRRLHVQLLLGKESEVSDLVLASEKQLKTRIENAKPIPDLDNVPGHKGTKLSRTPVEVKSGDWALKVVP
ncbi:Alpha-glucosidase 2, partial [Sesamum angolense]